MARFHTTSSGLRPYTAAEELAADAENALYAAGSGARLATAARIKRDELIAATDFYALSDVTMTTAMTTYRQALRDIPSQTGFPTAITWPKKP